MLLEGWRKKDEPVMKKLPVEVDVPEYLVKLGLVPGASGLVRATGDLALIAFYYLLRVGEYTTKGSRNESKQTVQFRMRDVVFFVLDEYGSDDDIMRRRNAQRYGWTIRRMGGGMCVLISTIMGMRFFAQLEQLAGATSILQDTVTAKARRWGDDGVAKRSRSM